MASHVSTLDSRRRVRRSFGQLAEVTPMPNLIDVQRSSYDTFLQMGISRADREEHGLQETFNSIFPIEDFAGRAKLEFVSYDLETPKYDVEECQQRGLTYASSLKVTLRLEVWEEDEVTGARSIRDIKEQDVYMGDMPLMTSNGTFIVNGTERVIVSRCTARRVCFSIMTGARPTRRASCCSRRESFPIVAPGWISNSTPRTS